MANTFRSDVGAYRNSLMAGAESISSPLASGFMKAGVGKGSRRTAEQIQRSSEFLDNYIGTFSDTGQAWNDMTARAGSQGIQAVGADRIYKAQLQAMEEKRKAGWLSGIANIASKFATIGFA